MPSAPAERDRLQQSCPKGEEGEWSVSPANNHCFPTATTLRPGCLKTLSEWIRVGRALGCPHQWSNYIYCLPINKLITLFIARKPACNCWGREDAHVTTLQKQFWPAMNLATPHPQPFRSQGPTDNNSKQRAEINKHRMGVSITGGVPYQSEGAGLWAGPAQLFLGA